MKMIDDGPPETFPSPLVFLVRNFVNKTQPTIDPQKTTNCKTNLVNVGSSMPATLDVFVWVCLHLNSPRNCRPCFEAETETSVEATSEVVDWGFLAEDICIFAA
jgi:hypothetical protein